LDTQRQGRLRFTIQLARVFAFMIY